VFDDEPCSLDRVAAGTRQLSHRRSVGRAFALFGLRQPAAQAIVGAPLARRFSSCPLSAINIDFGLCYMSSGTRFARDCMECEIYCRAGGKEQSCVAGARGWPVGATGERWRVRFFGLGPHSLRRQPSLDRNRLRRLVSHLFVRSVREHRAPPPLAGVRNEPSIRDSSNSNCGRHDTYNPPPCIITR
jgi:hypothetical protein